jgi:hypothetical protein
MRPTYMWLARLIAIGVVLQAAFIAWGTFDILNAAEDGEVYTGETEYNAGQAMHGMFGLIVIPLLVLVLLIVSFFAKVPGGVRAALIVLGVALLQIVLAFISFPAPVIGLLHGINAFALAGVAGYASRLAAKPSQVPPTPEAAPA